MAAAEAKARQAEAEMAKAEAELALAEAKMAAAEADHERSQAAQAPTVAPPVPSAPEPARRVEPHLEVPEVEEEDVVEKTSVDEDAPIGVEEDVCDGVEG